MSEHGKKMIAPIIITVLFVIYFCVYFGAIIMNVGGIARILLGIIPAILCFLIIYVCIQRIGEIKGGEEDDLSKY